jgi:hypothetical protein
VGLKLFWGECFYCTKYWFHILIISFFEYADDQLTKMPFFLKNAVFPLLQSPPPASLSPLPHCPPPPVAWFQPLKAHCYTCGHQIHDGYAFFFFKAISSPLGFAFHSLPHKSSFKLETESMRQVPYLVG